MNIVPALELPEKLGSVWWSRPSRATFERWGQRRNLELSRVGRPCAQASRKSKGRALISVRAVEPTYQLPDLEAMGSAAFQDCAVELERAALCSRRHT